MSGPSHSSLENTPWYRWFSAVLFGSGLLFLAPPVQAQDRTWNDVIADFAAGIDAEVTLDGIGGITAGIFLGTDLVWAQGFGFADRERHIPASVETIYRIASNSKSFTAVAMMQAADRGELDWDEAVETVLPEVSQLLDKPADAEPITYRHLATHMSGLVQEPRLENYDYGPLGAWEHKLLAAIPTTPYFQSPGVWYQYSNIGYGMLGLAVARAAGVPFMELVTSRIIEPLGMRNTGFAPTPEMWRHIAKGYHIHEDGTVDTDTPYREHAGRGYKVPNGGIYSTVGDLALFAAGVSGHAPRAILTPASRAAARRVYTPPGSERNYGLGFYIFPQPDGTVHMGHSGTVPGYKSFLLFEPESGIGVVILRNYTTGATDLEVAARNLLRDLMRAHG